MLKKMKNRVGRNQGKKVAKRSTMKGINLEDGVNKGYYRA